MNTFPAQERAIQPSWVFGMVGSSIVLWWTWTWTRVGTLVTEHVSANGALPIDEIALSALYVNGTDAEQKLSAELSSISGLYPWGFGPLLLGTVVAVTGFALARKQRKVSIAAIAIFATFSFVSLADQVTVALAILE